MTTRVYVVYVFGKHIHAFKLLIYSINRSVFRGRVYVWCLILKKIASSGQEKKAAFFLQLNQREIQQLKLILTF